MSAAVSTVYGIIGGSGVELKDRAPTRCDTPFGPCLVSSLDDAGRVLFVSRHHATDIDESTGEARYAPPVLVNYRAIIWALCVVRGCKRIVALASTGSLHTDTIPVGSVAMADDYYMVVPDSLSFWGQPGVGAFDGEVGQVHYTPANPADEAWVGFRQQVQRILAPLLNDPCAQNLKLAAGQTRDLWPCRHSALPGSSLAESFVYVNSCGHRFETRAEIRSYQPHGHVVGMTAGREWSLCEELRVPFCLLCFQDNACNGLSRHPQGPVQEYLENKKPMAAVTAAIVQRLTEELPS